MPIAPYKRLLCVGFLTEQMEAGRIDYYHQGKCGSGLVKRPRPVTRNIELEMIVNGWAWVVEQYSFEREDEYFRSEEHTSELQSLTRISYAVFCLKNTTSNTQPSTQEHN